MSRSRTRTAARTVCRIIGDVARFASAAVRSRAQLTAENLFLRKQLALYVERQVKRCRADDATRITLVVLSRLIEWRRILTTVKPDTLIRCHRKGFRLFWRWKSRPRGRPRLLGDVQRLIAEMASANRTWGEERIASELLVKLGIPVSPRTVRRYLPMNGAPRAGTRSQLWSTFVRNHANAVLACAFFVTITATFRALYVFVVLEVGTRRIRHWNVTKHPTADWTAQQFRMLTSEDDRYRFLIHDHDSIFSDGVDGSVAAIGLTILRTPVHSPQANAFCERLIGTIRRECLDWVVPLNEDHLRRFCGNGSSTTTGVVRTRAWGQAFRTVSNSRRCRSAIGFATATVSSRRRFSAVFITSTVSNAGPRERIEGTSRVFADHRGC